MGSSAARWGTAWMAWGLVLAAASGAAAQAGAPADGEDAVELQQADDLRDEQARRVFEAGRIAFTDGRYEQALRYFRDAYELSGRPALLFNIGTAADRLQRDREALEAFEQYLAEVPDAPNRREVQSRVRLLREAVEREGAAGSPSVPTPREAAQSDGETQTVPVAAGGRLPDDRTDSSLAGEWWLWTIVGVVVVAGVGLGVGLAARDTGGGAFVEEADATARTLLEMP